MNTKCIVIGAGATGLMAALELLPKRFDVVVLEARDRIGGRICTTHIENFSQSVESGAEFIHGDAPLTMRLLAEANIQHREMEGTPFQIRNGEISKGNFFDNEWQQLLDAMKKVRHDMPLAEFLQQYLANEKHNALRHKVRDFVEGYNAANVTTASTIALREEWMSDEDPVQLRPIGGYGPMMEHMRSRVEQLGGVIHLSTPVHRVEWKKRGVRIFSETESFEGEIVLVTIPIGVLQQETITFAPSIDAVNRAAKDFGFGNVIKVHFEFSTPVWESRFNKLGFLFSDAEVPTWWTQLPDQVPIITGWLGGPGAGKAITPEQWYDKAMDSLAFLLNEERDDIGKYLKAWCVSDWMGDPYTYGAYSFSTLTTLSAKKVLNTAIENTIFFAGEALYEGSESGTVEAALASAKQCAKKIIKHADG